MNGDRGHVVIAGAGLAGALLAAMLGRRGLRVTLCERRPDPRVRGFVGGRSINLALSVRGLAALRRVGLDEAVLGDAIPMPGRMVHAPDGATVFQPYSRDPANAINSVSRGGLNLRLVEAAAALPGVEILFGHRCVDADLDRAAAVFERHDGSTVEIAGDLLVGADGAFSAVRSRMQRTDRFDYSQSYLAHSYKELSIPATADGDFALEPRALHIWPRRGSMMIALPNADRTFTCTLFWPQSEFDQLRDDAATLAHFRAHYGDAVPLMPTLLEDFRTNPTSSLVTVRCAPWHHGDRVVLVGDAAHAIVPFYGQGMNCAFEDCAELDRLAEAHGTDWGRILPAYDAARKPNGDAIADLALANFVEMRDRVASPLFRARKRAEKLLHGLLGARWTPLYDMVSFSTIPYAEAVAIARRRERAVRRAAVAAGLLALVGLGALLF